LSPRKRFPFQSRAFSQLSFERKTVMKIEQENLAGKTSVAQNFDGRPHGLFLLVAQSLARTDKRKI
jgi:hypothetical protein